MADVESAMLVRLTVVCIWLAACGQSGFRGQAARDAQAPPDRAPDIGDSAADTAKPHRTDPLDGGLADGAVIEEPNGFETAGSFPLVAMDEQGNGIVVWSVRSGATSRVQARRYTAGVGWSDVELILEDGNAWSVALRNGAAIVALAGPMDAGLNTVGIYAARFTTGGWSIVPVGVTSTGSWQAPSLAPPAAALGERTALITWIDSSYNQAAASVFDVSWQPAQLFGTPAGPSRTSALPSGGFVVAWTELSQGDAASWITVSKSWDPVAGWLPELILLQDARNLQLAASLGGRPHALWSGSGGLMHAELLPSGEWGAAETVVDYDLVTSIDSQRLVADLASNALVAWTNHPGAACNSTVAARYYVEGAGWQGTTLLNPSQSESDYQLAGLAMSPNGDAWALWRSGPCNDFDREIWGHHFDPANGWSDPVKLDSSGACVLEGGAVAMGGNRALAAWSRTGTGGIVVRWLE
jgi:hypothetical protein